MFEAVHAVVVDAAAEADCSERAVCDADLATCVRVLNTLAKSDGGVSEEYREPRFKPLRIAIQRYLDDAHSRQFHGQAPDKYAMRKEKKSQKNAREQQERALDREAADKTRMRAERLRMLSELEASTEATDGTPRLALVPDGAVDESAPLFRLTDVAGAGTAEASSILAAEAEGGLTELRTLQACYTCKTRFRELHHFYAQLCPACATLNHRKRLSHADLTNRVFLVTGGRVKVGFQICLRLLRCGAHVLCTSRFPADTAGRFASMGDAPSWRHRLRCYGLDLRDLSSLERFCAHLIASGQRLDGIINNAAQTIRRPAAYYSHLVAHELHAEQWSADVSALLADHTVCFGVSDTGVLPALKPPNGQSDATARIAVAVPSDTKASKAAAEGGGSETASTEGNGSEAGAAAAAACATPAAAPPGSAVAPAHTASGGLTAAAASATAAVPSALWSQAPLWSAEAHVAQPDEGTSADFPVGLVDVNGQQLDTRRSNSWLLKLQDVSTPEAAEVLAINTLAPFVLNSRLRPLLEACPAPVRFVVNVSAMEGKFYRYKSPNHPHTNMAKAALNMMTRTCAEELAACSIFMNSVDTGWINDEKPLAAAAAHAEAHHFQTPLDEVDAASRVLDPILDAVNGAPPMHGKFLKDYAPVEW